MKHQNSMQTPLARVRGLGSAKSGLHHWWHQRLTAIALVPLMIVTLIVIARLGTLDYDGAMAMMANPFISALLLLLVLVGFYHAAMGLQVVLEDYVASEGKRMASIIFVKMALFALATLTILSILKVSL